MNMCDIINKIAFLKRSEKNMSAIIYVEMILISLSVCAIVFYLQQKSDTSFFKKQTFNIIIFLTSAMLLLDMFKFLIENGNLAHTKFLHATVVGLYYVLMCVLPMVIAKYCLKVGGVRFRKLGEIAIILPTVTSAILMIVNAVIPFLFVVDAETCYHELEYLPLLWIAPLAYIGFALVATVYIYIKDIGHRRSIIKHILTFIIVAIIASIAAIINKYITPWPIIAIDIAFLYMTIQSKRNHDASLAAFVDSLTGVKNAAAYRTMLFSIDDKIARGEARFAVAVMDISGLKNVNDGYGHSLGDSLIVTASKFICSVFAHSPVFRIGGDEFVVIMENSDYDNRDTLLEAFNEGIKNLNIYNGEDVIPVSIALGIAIYDKEREMRYADVFKLADRRMYDHKKTQKILQEKEHT